MRALLPHPTYYFILILAGSLAACSSERVTSGPAAPHEQEVLRLRAADANRRPVVFGQVQVVDNTGRYPLPKSEISVDGQPYYTNEVGNYRLAMTPGSHQFGVAQTGMRPTRFTLKVERGDSVRVNVYLRPAN